MPYSVDFSDDPKYNRKVKVVYEKDRAVFKLSQSNVTIYIGEVKNDSMGSNNETHDHKLFRSGEASSS